MTISAADLQTIKNNLFLLPKDLSNPSLFVKRPLEPPTNTEGVDDIEAKLDQIVDPDINKETGTALGQFGIGVVDFTKRPGSTADLMNPRIWVYHEDAAWRIASTGKLAILLAAVQLRDDVRLVKQVTGLTDPRVYDNLFAMPELWRSAPRKTKQIAKSKDHAPRISTILNLAADPVDFFGVDKPRSHALDQLDKSDPRYIHLTWEGASKLDFAERLWLAGALSDNVAAMSCISEIGVAYLKAVQRAYGLYDPARGMHMLLAGGYGGLKASVPVHGSQPIAFFRPLQEQDIELLQVTDGMLNKRTGLHNDQWSWESGSAAALLAYMIALMQNRFASLRYDPVLAVANLIHMGDACATIRDNLSDGSGIQTSSFIVEGISSLPNVRVTKTISKIGVLSKEERGKEEPLSCEFVYLETEQTDTGAKMQYGVVATGVTGIATFPNRDPSSPTFGQNITFRAKELSRDLGMRIHLALLAP